MIYLKSTFIQLNFRVLNRTLTITDKFNFKIKLLTRITMVNEINF